MNSGAPWTAWRQFWTRMSVWKTKCAHWSKRPSKIDKWSSSSSVTRFSKCLIWSANSARSWCRTTHRRYWKSRRSLERRSASWEKIWRRREFARSNWSKRKQNWKMKSIRSSCKRENCRSNWSTKCVNVKKLRFIWRLPRISWVRQTSAPNKRFKSVMSLQANNTRWKSLCRKQKRKLSRCRLQFRGLKKARKFLKRTLRKV